ncbi:MAG: hypothetical protein IKK47_06850 [Ruminococcus sp.]|nr:hypothetical protein [Ruminococcus sp.]
MKKFLTILLAMSMMSCTFASCGKKESDKEDKKNLSTEEEVHPAVGRWVPVEKEDTIFDIHSEDEAYICAVQDLSDDLYFEDDNFVFSGMEFSGDNYDFDGETFVLHAFSDNDLTMEKTDGSEELYGEFQWISGDLYDDIVRDFTEASVTDGYDITGDNIKTFMICNDEGTSLEIRIGVSDFELTDETITISGSIFGGEELRDAEYTVDGDKMIIINAQSEEIELERITDDE